MEWKSQTQLDYDCIAPKPSYMIYVCYTCAYVFV